MVLMHGVHKDYIYDQVVPSTNAGMVRPEDKEGRDEVDITAVYDAYNMKPASAKQQILSRAINLCDEEQIDRPTYIIEELKW